MQINYVCSLKLRLMKMLYIAENTRKNYGLNKKKINGNEKLNLQRKNIINNVSVYSGR